MAMSWELALHIAGGGIGLLSGTVAFATKKGGINHRLAGKWFVFSMFIMAFSGALIALFESVFITVFVGFLSLYLVLSGWLVTFRKSIKTSRNNRFILGLGLLVLAKGILLTWLARQGITDIVDGYVVPVEVYLTFTFICLIGVVGDIILLLKASLPLVYLRCRHIWRMSTALYIAAASFFDGQADIFPEALQGSVYLSVPTNLVLVLMLFWLLKSWWPKNQPS